MFDVSYPGQKVHHKLGLLETYTIASVPTYFHADIYQTLIVFVILFKTAI